MPAGLPGFPLPVRSGKSRYRFALKHLSILPGVLTSLNLFCGYLSVIATSKHEFLVAGWLIILAAIFDILDGRVARLTSVDSKFGAELDSLSDLVSFGVAPAFLVFTRYLSELRVIGFIVTGIFVLCGGLRLARFNITPPSDRDIFTGLPIPAGAAILCTMTIFEMQFFKFFRFPDAAVPLIVLVSAFLMVSNVEYPAMKKSKRTTNQRRLVVLVFLSALVVSPLLTLFFVSWGFAAYGILMAVLQKMGLFMGFLKRHSNQSLAL